MSDNIYLFDRNQNKIVTGDSIKIIEIPDWLPENLPKSDQVAIYEQIGKTHSIQGFDNNGRLEIEFIDSSGNYHTIWIEPIYVIRVSL